MKPLVAISAIGIAIAAAACGASDETPAFVEDDLRATEPIFGEDRVGAALHEHSDEIPTTLAEVEALFGVGRACARSDSKEIFVVEESRSRLPSGEVTAQGPLLPRAVVSGCNTGDLADPASVARSTSLFVALISDPDIAERTDGDGILKEPIEVMAYDERAGIYNFYVFDRGADGKPLVTRVYRSADGTVLERKLAAGGRASVPTPPADGGQRCFACHVNGAPLMNEMRDPWTNWISFKKDLPVSQLAGDTKQLVSEAVPSASTGRSSLANDLEPIMKSAIRAHVTGRGDGSGWARARAAMPGGLGRLMRSVLCETELNYATATDAVPLESFIDPDLSNGDLVAPDAFGDRPTPFQMPIRSVFDRTVEHWLVDNGYLSHEIVTAARLFDEANDIFSDARCALHDRITSAIGRATSPSEVKSRVRAALLEAARSAPFAETAPKRHAYLLALLATRPSQRALDAAYAAYATELAARFETMKSDRASIASRDAARKDRASRMFPGTSTPLPLFP